MSRKDWKEIAFAGPETCGCEGRKPKVFTFGAGILVGYKGKPWCFSAVDMGNNMVDIAVYHTTPERVLEKDPEAIYNAIYNQIRITEGWGYIASALVRQTKREELVELAEKAGS